MGRPAQVLLGALVLSVSAESWAAGVAQQRLACVPAGGHARVAATLPEGFAPASVRVYFRSAATKDEYFVEMRRSGRDGYWAVLPAPSLQTPSVAYRVVARGGDGSVLATDAANVPVIASCPATLSDEELRSARNLVVGVSSKGQPAVPTGFECRGIVARISADGDLSAYSACAEVSRAAMLARATPTPVCPGCGTLGIGGIAPVVIEPVCDGCGTPVIGPPGGVVFPTPTPRPSPTPTRPPVSGVRPNSSAN
jgi:hypothetical protein